LGSLDGRNLALDANGWCYHGPFLAGFSIPDSIPFEEWLTLRRERLHQQALRILRRLADYFESCGEYEQALIYARQQVEFEPWLEEAHRQIMRLLVFSEQASQALAQNEACNGSGHEKTRLRDAE
jgi:DNA-binding SARP family transcriptional activator